MGKYQLDGKGKSSTRKFHEKHSNEKFDKKAELERLKEKYLNQKPNNNK